MKDGSSPNGDVHERGENRNVRHETNLTKMVIVFMSKGIIGSFLDSISPTLCKLSINDLTCELSTLIGKFFLIISSSLNFFIYFKLNTAFHSTFKKLIKKIF